MEATPLKECRASTLLRHRLPVLDIGSMVLGAAIFLYKGEWQSRIEQGSYVGWIERPYDAGSVGLSRHAICSPYFQVVQRCFQFCGSIFWCQKCRSSPERIRHQPTCNGALAVAFTRQVTRNTCGHYVWTSFAGIP